MEPRVVTVSDPEQRLYPVALRNTSRQHVLFKIKIRRKQVEDWVVYPVMGMVPPHSIQTVYLTRKTSVDVLYQSQSGPILVETCVVRELDTMRPPQDLWDSVTVEERSVNVKSQVLPIEIRPTSADELNCSFPNSPITPAILQPPHSSVPTWLSSVQGPGVPPELPIPHALATPVQPPSSVAATSALLSPLLSHDYYIPPPPPYEKAVGYSLAPRDAKHASLQRQNALRIVSP